MSRKIPVVTLGCFRLVVLLKNQRVTVRRERVVAGGIKL
jgi:hypothetical protein